MAVGRPLVTTNVPGCRNVVQDSINGFLVESHNPEMLADAMIKLIEDENLRERMGRAGREMAETIFDEREVIRQTVEVYSKLSSNMPALDQWMKDSSAACPAIANQVMYDAATPVAS